MKENEMYFRTDLNKMNYQRIEEFIRNNPCKDRGIATDNSNLTQLPFVSVFYQMCDGKENPPTEEEFLLHYKDMLRHAYPYESNEQINGIMIRMARNYRSVVSELHFYIMTRDSGLFKVFPYYTYDDIRIGIDFRVSYDHKIHNIHLGLKSKNEAVFREIKKKRKEDRNEEVIDFYLDPGCALSVGGVWLHKPKDVEHLKEVIIKETNNAQ